METLSTQWHRSIAEIKEDSWILLNNIDPIPFYKWKWLHALEISNSIIARYGWQPLYLAIYRKKSLIGIAPLFLKGHSYGEFIFDHQFVELANYFKINYYPKLVGMSPVSPIEGYKFIFAKGEDEEYLTKFMMKEIDKFCINNQILSCNFLYVDPKWQLLGEKAECASWFNRNSVWNSEGNKDFSDYLARFNANQRRNIKRERKSIKQNGLYISVKHGIDIKTKEMRMMHNFYQQHCQRWGAWGSKYLSEAFFENLALPGLREHIVLFTAHSKESINPKAMSLCITNKEMLWGRYWGSTIEMNNLHFELCYYSPIEWALDNGIKNFDPGAGGSHKQRRGFITKPTVSLHRWYDNRINKLIRDWLPKANELIMEEIKATNNEVPFTVTKPKLSSME